MKMINETYLCTYDFTRNLLFPSLSVVLGSGFSLAGSASEILISETSIKAKRRLKYLCLTKLKSEKENGKIGEVQNHVLKSDYYFFKPFLENILN